MNHSPRVCKICGGSHCLAGCVPVGWCEAVREGCSRDKGDSSSKRHEPENPPGKPPENKHSPRPWTAQPWYGGGILDNDGKLIGYHYKPGDFSWDTHQANRNLILDAVNGQKALEKECNETAEELQESYRLLLKVKAQRDELVALVERTVKRPMMPPDAYHDLKQALKKIKGGK